MKKTKKYYLSNPNLKCEKCGGKEFLWIQTSPWHEEIIPSIPKFEKTGKIIKTFLGWCKKCEFSKNLVIEKGETKCLKRNTQK